MAHSSTAPTAHNADKVQAWIDSFENPHDFLAAIDASRFVDLISIATTTDDANWFLEELQKIVAAGFREAA
jgi:hypothetical protein